MFPDVTIVMTTYFPDVHRRSLAEETLRSWTENLRYNGDLHLHCADDGSNHIWHPELIWKGPITYSYQERRGVGASLNRGFAKAFETSPYVLYAVDDWWLAYPIDFTHWVMVLEEREDVGMVRLGPPHPNIRGHVEAFTDYWNSWGLRLDRYGFAFGHRPALYHRRMIETYGWFEEGVSALECERLYAENFSRTEGPDIVLSLSSPWYHTSTESLSAIEPEG
jgi:hypothetical protein